MDASKNWPPVYVNRNNIDNSYKPGCLAKYERFHNCRVYKGEQEVYKAPIVLRKVGPQYWEGNFFSFKPT